MDNDYRNSYSNQWQQDNPVQKNIFEHLVYGITYIPKFIHFIYRGVWDFFWRYLR